MTEAISPLEQQRPSKVRKVLRKIARRGPARKPKQLSRGSPWLMGTSTWRWETKVYNITKWILRHGCQGMVDFDCYHVIISVENRWRLLSLVHTFSTC
jgi:hypothetical protein